jgi:hypothetical protein
MFTSERGATWAPGRAGAGAKCVTRHRIGWVLGVPCLTLQTCRVAVLNSTCSHRRSTSSDVRKLACSAFGDTRRRKRKKAGDDR